jgi:hypothetical protein
MINRVGELKLKWGQELSITCKDKLKLKQDAKYSNFPSLRSAQLSREDNFFSVPFRFHTVPV